MRLTTQLNNNQKQKMATNNMVNKIHTLTTKSKMEQKKKIQDRMERKIS